MKKHTKKLLEETGWCGGGGGGIGEPDPQLLSLTVTSHQTPCCLGR